MLNPAKLRDAALAALPSPSHLVDAFASFVKAFAAWANSYADYVDFVLSTTVPTVGACVLCFTMLQLAVALVPAVDVLSGCVLTLSLPPTLRTLSQLMVRLVTVEKCTFAKGVLSGLAQNLPWNRKRAAASSSRLQAFLAEQTSPAKSPKKTSDESSSTPSCPPDATSKSGSPSASSAPDDDA